MDLEKYFTESFGVKCLMTQHSLERINERFMYAELPKLRLIVQAAMRQQPFQTWKAEEYVALVDPRFNFSMVCVGYPQDNIVKIITFIRGKTPEKYKECRTISVSLMKEKSDQEVAELNAIRKKSFIR